MARIIYCRCGNVFHVGDRYSFHCRRCGREYFNDEKVTIMGRAFSALFGKSTPDFIVNVKSNKKPSVKNAYFMKKRRG